MSLSFNLILGFSLTWTGISQMATMAYDLLLMIFRKSRFYYETSDPWPEILFLAGACFLTYYGIQILQKEFQKGVVSFITCTCGRRSPPQAKFCTMCGRKIGET